MAKMIVSDKYTQREGIYIRLDNPVPFLYNDGDDCENYILDAIQQAKDLGTGSPELQRHIRDWQTLYHFAPQRADLLRPFAEFLSNKKILEVGSGCGAITRFLGETGADIIALEGSLRRAAITNARCRDLDNVKVINDHFEHYAAAEKADVIILTGVLEYSNLFMPGDHPDQELLKKVASLLNENGKIFVAIENKLGLKYWAGAPEDHIGQAFYGLENRYHKNSATTYGKDELDQLLKDSGFLHREFYFPFPDYKFPSVILCEKSLDLPGFRAENLIAPLVDSVQNRFYPGFAMHRVWTEVIRNKLTASLSNSFLVVAGVSEASVVGDDILGYAYSSSRQPEYAKENKFSMDQGKILVSRKKIHPEKEARPDAFVVQHMDDEPYFPGTLYYLSFLDIVSTPGWSVKDIRQWIRPYYELLKDLSEGPDDSPKLPGKYLDVNPFNILTDQGQLHYFDQEWEADESVPLRFILFRGLFYCLSKCPSFYHPQENTALFAFGLIKMVLNDFIPDQDELVNEFIRLENKYFGNIGLIQNYEPADFPLPVIFRRNDSGDFSGGYNFLQPLSKLNIKIFFQTEENVFSEKDSVSQKISLTNRKTVYHIPLQTDQPVRKIRIDPSEQTGLIKLYSISIKDKLENELIRWSINSESVARLTDILTLKPETAQDHYVLFLLSDDPMIELTLPERIRSEGGQHLDIRLEMEMVQPHESVRLSGDLNKLLQLMAYSGSSNIPMIQQSGDDKNTIADQLAYLTREVSKPLYHRLERAVALAEEKTSKIKLLNADLKKLSIEKSGLQEENEQLKEHLNWYHRTYETRSFAGLIKERLNRAGKRISVAMLNRLVNRPFFQKKYAASYLLGYIRDNGMGSFARAGVRAFRENGIKSVTECRSIVRNKWIRAAAQRNNSALPIVKDDFKPEELLREIEKFHVSPKISIIVPTYNTDPGLLELAIASVKNQLYENWELCITDDGSTLGATKNLLKLYSDNPRIKINFLSENVGISEASNASLEMATGDYIALLDHDDELTMDALFHIVKDINDNGDADIIYTDECKVDEEGRLSDYFLKPDWSPELLFNMMYIGHLTVYRKEFLELEVGRFRKKYDFSQDYDLILRAVEHTRSIRHIPQVLYHWRLTEGSATMGGKMYARMSNLAALEDAVKRRNIQADVIELPVANRVKFKLEQKPLVSLIIPTDSFNNLFDCLQSLLGHTSYPDYEIIVVTNSGLISMMQEQIASPRLSYLPFDKPYNFSEKCNCGAARAVGDVLIFFNDDVRPLQNDWIENTIEFLSLDGVGGVSPKLLYEDDSIQYAGMASGVRNLTGTTFHGFEKDSLRYFNFPQLVRNVSILSGACLAMKKSLFISFGGFNAVDTPSNHSDVDLSFKIRERGFRCIYTPYATLRHIGHLSLKEHENKLEKTKKDKSDIYLLKRWIDRLGEDEYFTQAMRGLLYHDSPEPYQIYPSVPGNRNGEKGDVLLISHDLSLTGAPIMLYYTALILSAQGYYVLVSSVEDGPVRKMYQQSGIDVITDELILSRHPGFLRFARNFDYIICNTVVTWPVVAQLQGITKTIWWLQEAEVIERFLAVPDFAETLESAQNLITVSDYANSFVRRYNPCAVKLYNACDDLYEAPCLENATREKIIISIIGSIEPRKGQDVLLDSLNYLTPVLLDKTEIWIVGRTHDPDFKMRLDNHISEAVIRYTGEVSHEQCIEYMRRSDILISASRDDPFPVVLVEAFSMAKACIVSSHSGVCELIEDGDNGLIFENENAEALGAAISYLLTDPSRIRPIGLKARKTYDKHLTLGKFAEQFLNYLSSVFIPSDLEELSGIESVKFQHY